MEQADAKTSLRKVKSGSGDPQLLVAELAVTLCTRAFPDLDPLYSLLQLHTSHPYAIFQHLPSSIPLFVLLDHNLLFFYA